MIGRGGAYSDRLFILSRSNQAASLRLWAPDETLTILPCIPDSLAVAFIFSRSRFVSRKCPVDGWRSRVKAGEFRGARSNGGDELTTSNYRDGWWRTAVPPRLSRAEKGTP